MLIIKLMSCAISAWKANVSHSVSSSITASPTVASCSDIAVSFSLCSFLIKRFDIECESVSVNESATLFRDPFLYCG